MTSTRFPSPLGRALAASGTLLLSTLYAHAQAELIISEINFNPATADGLTEFVEIKNVGDAAADVTGYQIDGVGVVTWTNTNIAPGEFLVVTENAAAFQARYGFAADAVFANGLSGKGERLDLIDNLNNELFSVRYWDGGTPDIDGSEEGRDEWPSSTDGTGYSLVTLNPSGNPDPDAFQNWRPSINIGGSPGADEPLPDPLQVVFVNEVRSRDGSNTNDAVEIYNPGTSAIDLGDWFLSDSLDNPKNIPLPNNSIIQPGGYLVLQNGVNGVTLSLSSKGERAFIYSANSAGTLTGYVDGLHFGPSGDGATFSRHLNTDGRVQFPAMAPSLGNVNGQPPAPPVVITEIMYDQDPDGDEFIEIQNISGGNVGLFDPANTGDNWRVEGVSFVLNGAQPTLVAGEIALIVPTDPTTFRNKHGVPATTQIFGPYATGIDPSSLRNGGEIVALQRPETIDAEQVYIDIDIVEYDNRDPWPESAAGEGNSLERPVAASYGNQSTSWQAGLVGGTPGVIPGTYTGGQVYINEILAHTDLPQVDLIELHNPGTTPVNIGGWWLSDSRGEPKKFQIPSGTVIAGGDYWTVNQDNNDTPGAPAGYFGNAFGLSENGESLMLTSAQTDGTLTGYQDAQDFPGTDNGVSVGRVIDSQGRASIVPLQSLTFTVNRFTPNPAGAANSAPKIGPVVISEVRYDPLGLEPEFIELKNITASPVALYDSINTANTWLFSSGVDFAFPAAFLVMPANGTMVILPAGTDVNAFRAAHSIPAQVQIFGGANGFSGALNNSGEQLVLSKRGAPNPDEGGAAPVIMVDYVDYQATAPWPVLGTDSGRSIERIDLAMFGGEASNWKASNAIGGSPGATNSTGTVYGVWENDTFTLEEIAAGNTGSGDDFNGDGNANLLAYAYGYNPGTVPPQNALPKAIILDDTGGRYLGIEFRMNQAASDLNFLAEVSIDVSNWTETSMQFGAPVDNGDGTSTIKIRHAEDIADNVRLFIRGKVLMN